MKTLFCIGELLIDWISTDIDSSLVDSVNFINNEFFILFPMILFGIGWAAIMGLPYSMVSPDIPSEKRGVYMGIINMMIVIPMLLQTISFGFIYKNLLGSNPVNAILLAGVLFVLASISVTFMKVKKVN